MYSYVQSMLCSPVMDAGNSTVLTSPLSNSQLQNLPAPTVYAFYVSRPLIDIYKTSTVPAFYNMTFRVLQWTLNT